jgi:hypothetical protein
MYGYCYRVLDNLKDYAVRALVNAVDHLGTVAYKLTDIFDQQSSDVGALDYKVSSLNQVIFMPFIEYGIVFSRVNSCYLLPYCWHLLTNWKQKKNIECVI